MSISLHRKVLAGKLGYSSFEKNRTGWGYKAK